MKPHDSAAGRSQRQCKKTLPEHRDTRKFSHAGETGSVRVAHATTGNRELMSVLHCINLHPCQNKHHADIVPTDTHMMWGTTFNAEVGHSFWLPTFLDSMLLSATQSSGRGTTLTSSTTTSDESKYATYATLRCYSLHSRRGYRTGSLPQRRICLPRRHQLFTMPRPDRYPENVTTD